MHLQKTFLCLVLFFLFFSVQVSVFADSKQTSPTAESNDQYSATRNYSANQTIRIATGILENNNSVKISGFKKNSSHQWVTNVFTSGSNALTITSKYSTGANSIITENISSTTGNSLRLKIFNNSAAPDGTKSVWWANWKNSSATDLHSVGSFSSSQIDTILSNSFQSLGNFPFGVIRRDTYIEAKVEAVCTIPSGYTHSNPTTYNGNGQYIFQESGQTGTKNNFVGGTQTVNFSCGSSGGAANISGSNTACSSGYSNSGNSCVQQAPQCGTSKDTCTAGNFVDIPDSLVQDMWKCTRKVAN